MSPTAHPLVAARAAVIVTLADAMCPILTRTSPGALVAGSIATGSIEVSYAVPYGVPDPAGEGAALGQYAAALTAAGYRFRVRVYQATGQPYLVVEVPL